MSQNEAPATPFDLTTCSREEAIKELARQVPGVATLPAKWHQYITLAYLPLMWGIARLAPECMNAQIRARICSGLFLGIDGGRWVTLTGRLLDPKGRIRWQLIGQPKTTRRDMTQCKFIRAYPAPTPLSPDRLADSGSADLLLIADSIGDDDKILPGDGSASVGRWELLVTALRQKELRDFAGENKALLWATTTELHAGILRQLARDAGYDVEGPFPETIRAGEALEGAGMSHWMRLRFTAERCAQQPPAGLRTAHLTLAYRAFSQFLPDHEDDKEAWYAKHAGTLVPGEDESTMQALVYSTDARIEVPSGRILQLDADGVMAPTDLRVSATLMDEFPREGSEVDALTLRVQRLAWATQVVTVTYENDLKAREVGEAPGSPPQESDEASAGKAKAEDAAQAQNAQASPRPMEEYIKAVPPPPGKGTLQILAVNGILGRPGTPPAETLKAARTIALEWLVEHKFAPSEQAARSWTQEAAHGEATTEGEGDRLWAMRFDDRRGFGDGSVWRTEVTLLADEERVLFGLRLSQVRVDAQAPLPQPAVPRLVVTLADRLVLHDGGTLLRPVPWLVTTDQVARLIAQLEDPRRDRAIILAGLTDDTAAVGDSIDKLARRLAGIAHVVAVGPSLTTMLAARYGDTLAPRTGRIRLYRPGFEAAAMSFDHPHWPVVAGELAPAAADALANEACAIALDGRDIDEHVPTFTQARDAIGRERTRAAVAATQERTTSLKEEVERFRIAQHELQARLTIAEELNEEMVEELRTIRKEREDLRADRDTIKTALRDTERRLAAAWRIQETRTGNMPTEPVYPDTWDALESWAAKYGNGRLVIHPQAARSARASAFREISFAYQVMHLLAHEYTAMRERVHGDEDPRIRFEARAAELGIEVSMTGEALNNRRYKDTYACSHEGRQVPLDWHAKTRGGSYDQAYQFRLYFHYEPGSGKVIVGHLPTHLRNSITT